MENKAWGLPICLPFLKDIYFKNVIRKAQAEFLHKYALPVGFNRKIDLQDLKVYLESQNPDGIKFYKDKKK